MEQMTLVDKSRMKRSNRRLLFQEVYQNPAISRPELARRTGISVMSAGRIVDELCALGLLRERGEAENHAQGRPPRLLQVARETLLCAGAFIEPDGVQVGVCDPYGGLSYLRAHEAHIRDMQPEDAVTLIASLLADARRECPGTLAYVGVSVPGLTDNVSGVVRFSSQLRWRELALAGMLEARMPGVSVAADNDIKAWALAEKQFGAAAEYRDAVMLHVASGIGAAAVVDGALHRGRGNMAGEIGHIAVDPGGRMCQCGRIGCIQTELSDWGILREARAVCPGAELADVFTAYDAGEGWACALVSRVAAVAAMTVNLLVNTYAPEAVVLCGGIFERFPTLYHLVSEARQRPLNAFSDSGFELKMSKFGAQGAVIGAAALAFQKMLDDVI